MHDVQRKQGLHNSVRMLTNEWAFIKIRAAEFELHKLCAGAHIQRVNNH
jgi:hypothetical protein